MKIAVITGASSGLGATFVRIIADRYGQDLDEIWVIARRQERLEELAKDITSCTIRPLPMDLSSRDSYPELRRLLQEYQADVRILVDNAGYCSCGRFDGMADNDIYTILDLESVARTSLDRASSGKGFYTPGLFCKGYRVASKVLPHALLVKATDGMF